MSDININPYLIIGAALTLTVSLAWNDAIQSAINKYYPTNNAKSVETKIVYAVVLTIIIIVVVYILNYAHHHIPAISQKLIWK